MKRALFLNKDINKFIELCPWAAEIMKTIEGMSEFFKWDEKQKLKVFAGSMKSTTPREYLGAMVVEGLEKSYFN